MESISRITTDSLQQAYSLAPWRKQIQGIARFLLAVVTVATVAGFYLNVTAQATKAGREIQELQVRVYGYQGLTWVLENDIVPIEELEQNIANLRAELAYQSSYERMMERAVELGLRPIDPDDVLYLEVAGYVGPQPAELAPPPVPVVVSAAGIDPAFKESLFEWFGAEVRDLARMFQISRGDLGVQP